MQLTETEGLDVEFASSSSSFALPGFAVESTGSLPHEADCLVPAKGVTQRSAEDGYLKAIRICFNHFDTSGIALSQQAYLRLNGAQDYEVLPAAKELGFTWL